MSAAKRYEEHMKDMAHRYVALGYAAIVLALYSRDGFLTMVEESDLDLALEALAARPNAQTIGDLDLWPFWDELGHDPLHKHMPGNAEALLRLTLPIRRWGRYAKGRVSKPAPAI